MSSSFKKALILMTLLISCSPAFAYDFKVGDLYYDLLSETTCTVTNGEGEYEGDLIIPSKVTYEGKTISVTSIGNGAFYGCRSLTGIFIPNSVSYIGEGAFSDCNSLVNIVIPNTVENIGARAFGYCISLESISFGTNLKLIGNDAFSRCKAMKKNNC